MYLKKFIYVNWGNIPNRVIEFDQINLFSGGNGSGKTTAADAIQTLMTAAHDGAFHFNPGQDESTQRGRGGKQVRTLASYVLGCDDGAYARVDTTDGYLAGLFYPNPGEQGEPFVAVIGVRAYIDSAGTQRVAREDSLQFYILRIENLELSQFEKSDSGGKYVVPLDRIHNLLKQELGPTRVERYDRKKQYLCRLYGALRGRTEAVSEREAMHAARAFSRFMAYKPVSSINDFVATEVLEAKDLGRAISDVSAMLKRIHGLEQEARSLRESIERVAGARDAADSYIGQWLEQQVLSYKAARSRFIQAQKTYLHSKEQQQACRAALEQCEQEHRLGRERREQLAEEIRELEIRRLGIPALRDKDSIERELEHLRAQLGERATALLRADQTLRANVRACTEIKRALQQSSIALALPALADKALREQVIQLAESAEPLDLHSIINRDWIDLSPLEAELDASLALQQRHNQLLELWRQQGVADSLAEEVGRRQQELDKLRTKLRQLEHEVAALENQRVSYPPQVRAALELIQRELPEADARVLCDHVEITDPRWQSAIEGYLGGNRFGILVAAEYEAEAAQLLKHVAGGKTSAKVIQGDKARQDAARLSIGSDSVVQLMNFSHATAEAYIRASYANLICVDSAEQLKRERRGLCADGLASGNYAMFRCDLADAQLVFGQSARQRALLAKRERLSQLQEQLQQASDQCGALRQLQLAVKPLAAVDYADQLGAMLSLQRQLHKLEESLGNLDLTEHAELEQLAEQLQARDQQLQQQLAALEEQRVEHAAKLRNLDTQCQRLSEAQEQRLDDADASENNLLSLARMQPDFDPQPLLQAADNELTGSEAERLELERESLERDSANRIVKLKELIWSHNSVCAEGDAIAFAPDFNDASASFKMVCEARAQLDQLFNRLNNNTLAGKSDQLGKLRQEFNHAFISHLCHAIYQAVRDGKETLDRLNSELEQYRFGADRERFYFGYSWVAEFKDYWHFLEAVMKNPALEDGQGLFGDQLDAKLLAVRDRLLAMLLDDDEHKALRELQRIADYRNYRSYEIYKEPEGKPPIALSQYGTGSGGQLETPAYIIRSAAITSAFRFNEGDTHLRMVLVDEAFSKMDEHRSKEVINYLTESLGLQLLFIMPSSKCGPFMDLVDNKTVFTKCPVASKVGELSTRVLVDCQKFNRDKVKGLWAERRQAVGHQAALDFMAEFAEAEAP